MTTPDGNFNNLFVSGRTDLGGSTDTSGDLRVGRDPSQGITASLSVTGSTTLHGPFTVTNSQPTDLGSATRVRGPLTVDAGQRTSLGGALEVQGSTTLQGPLTIAAGQPTDLGGTTRVRGALSVDPGQSTALGGALRVQGSATLQGPLTVAAGQPTDLGGTTRVRGPLTVDPGQSTALGGNLTVGGAATLHSLQVTGTDVVATRGALAAQGDLITHKGLQVHNAAGHTIARVTTTTTNGGFVETCLSSGKSAVQLTTVGSGNAERGYLAIYDSAGAQAVWLEPSGVRTNGSLWSKGAISTQGSILAESWMQTRGTLWADNGVVAKNSLWLRNTDNRDVAKMTTTTTNGGFIETYLSGGKRAVRLTTTGSGNSEQGYMAVYDAAGNQAVWMQAGGISARNGLWIRNAADRNIATVTTTSSNGGFIETYRSNGSPAVRITTAGGGKAGWLGVYKEDGSLAHWLDGAGGKHFIMRHPQDPGQNIVYAALEGPECAAYLRGQASLSNGQAHVDFPEHFALVVNPKTITIQLTPRAADSQGLAVVEQTDSGFTVQELTGGNGSYTFDYFVAGVRQGFEDYQPVVPQGFTALGESIDEEVQTLGVSPFAAGEELQGNEMSSDVREPAGPIAAEYGPNEETAPYAPSPQSDATREPKPEAPNEAQW